MRDPNEIPGYDKVKARLERARQEKLEKELITGRGIPAQMKAKIVNNIPDTGFAMTHKPSKFASSFGNEGSQLVPKKSKYVSTQARASPDAAKKQTREEANKNMKMNSGRSGKSSKKAKKSPKSPQEPA